MKGTIHRTTKLLSRLAGSLMLGMLVLGCHTNVSAKDTTPPAEVTKLETKAGDGKVSLSWTNPTDADLHQVEISATPAAGTLANPVYLSAEKGKAMSFTAEGLTNGTAYTFTVKTLDKALNSSTGVTTEAVKPMDTSDKTPPAEVGNLQAEALAGAIRLTWTDPTDADLWGIEITSQQKIVGRSVAPLSENAILVAKGEQSRKISNLMVGQSYTFTVKTIDNSGNKSAGIKTTAVTPKTGEPMTLTLEQNPEKTIWTKDSVTITVKSSTSIKKAKWKEGSGHSAKDVLENGTAITGNSFTVTVNGIYSVAVQDNDGRREVETIKIENIDKTPPAAVKNLTVSYSAVTKKITVSWQNPADSDFAGITLNWKKGTESTTSVELPKTDTQYELPETAEIGEEYRVAVRAKDDFGNESDEASTSGAAGGLNFTSFTIPNADISKAGSTVTTIVKGVNFTASGITESDFSVSCTALPSITNGATITVIDNSTLQVTLTLPGTADDYTVTVKCGVVSTTATFSVKDYRNYTVGKIVLANNTPVDKDSYTAVDENNPPVGIICGINSYDAPRMIALHTGYGLGWAEEPCTGYNTKFEGIICSPSSNGVFTATTATFTGDTDGSDNWEYICSIDPKGTANAATNYPAFNWVNQYNTQYAAQLGGTNFTWYMPSLAELCEVCKNSGAINASLAKIRNLDSSYADASLDDTAGYWSSSQGPYGPNAWCVSFKFASVGLGMKFSNIQVCCVAGL